MTLRILAVDDDEAMLATLREALTRRRFEVTTARGVEEARGCLSEDWDVVLSDLRLGPETGLDLCRKVQELRPGVPVVVMTGFGSIESAVGAIRAGAYDYVTKPVDIDSLELVLRRAAEHKDLTSELTRLRRHASPSFEALQGRSEPMRRLFRLMERVAETDSTVLVVGESGTGKELAARAIHARSRRATGPFIAMNCAAMPDALLESELFGHTRGAFTDAARSRGGLVLKAEGGTLLLDEIGEMPMALQPKLLRALQERRLRPVGSDDEIAFDVRILASTNRNLEEAVAEGRFREDLYYRINVIEVRLPPLRDRGGDVLLLAQGFVETFAARMNRDVRGIATEAAERLLAYPWPGNVRELANAMERAVALAAGAEISVDCLPEKIARHVADIVIPTDDPSALVPLEEVERRYILGVIEALGGNKTLAARTLGVDRKTLYRKLALWGLDSDGGDPGGPG